MSVSYAITDDVLSTVAQMIGYGITYWATDCHDWDSAPNNAYVGFYVPDEEKDFFLTKSDLRKAIRALRDGTAKNYDGTPFRGYARDYILNAYADADEHGIDAGHIDSDAGDIIAQIAALGRVIYG